MDTAELSVRRYGATGDGVHWDTDAIQNAIDACHGAGGGRVVLEPGVYLSRTLQLKSHVELHLRAGARLQGGRSPEDYDDVRASGFLHANAPEGHAKALVYAVGAEKIAITGAGEIHGAGGAFYDKDSDLYGAFYAKPDLARPRMIQFIGCCHVRIQEVSLLESPCWTVWLIDCEHVDLKGLTVKGDQKMINNDGIDIDSCRHVTVSDCDIKTADDCMVIRAIQPVLEKPGVCEDVVVRDCRFDSACQGIRIGCPDDNIIRDCVLENIVITGTGNGISIDNPRVYLFNGSKGRMDLSHVRFRNIRIDCGRHPVRITVEPGIRLARLSGISFEQMHLRGKLPILLNGNPETILEDIRFEDVVVDVPGPDAMLTQHCRGLVTNNVRREVAAG